MLRQGEGVRTDCSEMVGSSRFVVEAGPLERPVALAVHSKAGARNSRPRSADVAERLEALNQQALDVRQKLRRTAASVLEFEPTVQDAHLILTDAVDAPKILKELGLVLAVQATARRRVVSLTDVQ